MDNSIQYERSETPIGDPYEGVNDHPGGVVLVFEVFNHQTLLWDLPITTQETQKIYYGSSLLANYVGGVLGWRGNQ